MGADSLIDFATVPELRTERLILRGWREADLEPFAAMNADPQVMVFIRAPMTREDSDAMVLRVQEKWRKDPQFGWWAVELAEEKTLIGFVGVSQPDFTGPRMPCVEIGWRLALPYWGRGLASEAARAGLDYGFATVGLDEIVSFTVPGNRRSRAMMKRLGMTQDLEGGFEHPLVPEGSVLRQHVLYRLSCADWEKSQ